MSTFRLLDMRILGNYVAGAWQEGEGEGQLLCDASTGEPLFRAGTRGVDMAAVVRYARRKGNPALRKMTFAERGRMLRALALYLTERKERYYALSLHTGATRADGWIDIEGGFGNLFAYASLRRRLPDETYCTDGEPHPLGRQRTFMAQHLLVPKEGVAIHINAFNFPVWGMLEKCAVNWLAGMPAVVKPATLTSYLTECVVRDIIASGILPDGALQLLCGSAGDLLDHVGPQDVVTFTGSAATGQSLRAHPALLRESVPFNMEADSLNSLVLGEDVRPGTADWDLFVREVRREMTVKAGQKCTAIRRIFVPEALMEDAWKAIARALDGIPVGDPRHEQVRMGPLAGPSQREEVRDQVRRLLASTRILHGSLDGSALIGADYEAGAFLSPLLLGTEKPFEAREVHDVEAFGPVSTLMPYRGLDEAVELSKMGKGSLCSSIVTSDSRIATDYVVQAGTHHGRILILNEACAKESTGHGSPLPLLVHGGPGRAGGGEEMGGLRGLAHYMQRVAVQGSPAMLSAVTHIHQPGDPGRNDGVHPFRKHFEDLQVGDTHVTHRRTITEADISSFANLSWDHFYAHTDHTSLEGTPFDRPVAHGYFILSAAAGLFVDPAKGPVLLNYGLEDCRFTKPVYAGATIGVRLTCKQKMDQETRDGDDIPKGIVKWLVEVSDETGEAVAVATILTMVRKRGDARQA
jgi:oxepin-CoA hydrolase/3-oxo-5,6-dehydrosuberyl-CoA semialdehyde dehydrogenase